MRPAWTNLFPRGILSFEISTDKGISPMRRYAVFPILALGGGVIGITQSCACPETACAFLDWLYADLVAPVFTMLGGLSPCRSAYQNRDINEQYPWLSTARKSFPHAQRRSDSTYYSNFSELRLETMLASHIQKAVLGVCSPVEALRQAQEDCEQYFHPW